MASENQKPAAQLVNPIVVIAVFLVVMAMVLIFWRRFHTPIATGYSWVRVIEFAPFLLLNSVWAIPAGACVVATGAAILYFKKAWGKVGIWTIIAGVMILVGYFVGELFSSWFGFLKGSDKASIEWWHITKSSLYANLFTLVVGVIPLAVWIARRSLQTNIANHKHFAKGSDYTLHTFTDQMAHHYPHLGLFRKLNLTERPINTGKYRMADTEKQFAIKHGLLDRVKANEFKVNRERSVHVFAGQMTKLWKGFGDLSRWELAILAVLLPRIAATDPDMSDADYKKALQRTDDLLLGYWKDAAASYDEETDTLKLNLKLARDTVKKYGGSARVKKFLKAHAYVGTVIYAMLVEARSLGVLQPAEMRWLRVVDRQLWMIVDNVGRIVATTECSATYSHFVHELKQKRAIERPMVDAAVRALIEGVESYAFSSEEVAQINKGLQETEEKATVDLQAMAKDRKNMVLMLASVGVGPNKTLFEAVVMGETGEVVYEQRCNVVAAVDAEAKERYALTDVELEAMAKLPAVQDVCTKLLEVCNGHNLVTFDKADLQLVPEIERSAASVIECRGEDRFSLQSMAVMVGILEEHESGPLRSARAAAELCRRLWVAQQKQALSDMVKERYRNLVNSALEKSKDRNGNQ